MSNTLIIENPALNSPNNEVQTTTNIAAMLEAQAKAQIEARYRMALIRPRDWNTVRVDILNECNRPSFARNASTWYKKPIGKGIEGFGIRFVESAIRCMKNIFVQTISIHDDSEQRILKVMVTDLESNSTYDADVTIIKTVERSKPMDDGSYISVRKNSYGKNTYTVPGTDDDILNKQNSLLSKTVRTLGLRLIPGDILDECEDAIRRIRKDSAAKDPKAEIKSLIDAFASFDVKPNEISDYLGHDIARCSPKELVDLRGIYGAIKDGESSWDEVIDNKAKTADTGKNTEDLIKQNGVKTIDTEV